LAIGPTIETERLILRPPRAEDFDSWVAFHADEEVMKHLGGTQGPELTWRSICTLTGAWTIGGFSMFSVIEKASGQWIGRLGPWCPHGWPGTEVGWGLIRSAWGKGFATEGASAAMDYAVDIVGWSQIIHTILPENEASMRVAKRLGSQFMQKMDTPPPFAGMIWDVYGQSADEWRARRG